MIEQCSIDGNFKQKLLIMSEKKIQVYECENLVAISGPCQQFQKATSCLFIEILIIFILYL